MVGAWRGAHVTRLVLELRQALLAIVPQALASTSTSSTKTSNRTRGRLEQGQQQQHLMGRKALAWAAASTLEGLSTRPPPSRLRPPSAPACAALPASLRAAMPAARLAGLLVLCSSAAMRDDCSVATTSCSSCAG